MTGSPASAANGHHQTPEGTPPEAPGEAPWTSHLGAVREALAQKNLGAAVRAWEQAHLAAVGSWRWEGLIEVGDVYLRIGDASGARKASEATARKAYFAALFRACQRDSCEGILRIAQAFADLGDRQVVEECVGLAELVAPDDEARVEVRAVAAQLTDRLAAAAEMSPWF